MADSIPKRSSVLSKLRRLMRHLKQKRQQGFDAARHELLHVLLAASPAPSPGALAPLFPLHYAVPSAAHSRSTHVLPDLLHIQSHSPPSYLISSPCPKPSFQSLPIHTTCTEGCTPDHLHIPEFNLPSTTSRSTQNNVSSPIFHLPLSSPPGSTPCGDHSLTCHHHILWLIPLLALTCTFFYVTGKAMALLLAISANLMRKWHMMPSIKPKSPTTFSYVGLHSPVKQHIKASCRQNALMLNRSATVPRHRVARFARLRSGRSKSWSKLCTSSGQECLIASDVGIASRNNKSNKANIKRALGRRCELPAELKLQMVLLSILCGLFYGKLLAVCAAIGCLFSFSMTLPYLKSFINSFTKKLNHNLLL